MKEAEFGVVRAFGTLREKIYSDDEFLYMIKWAFILQPTEKLFSYHSRIGWMDDIGGRTGGESDSFTIVGGPWFV